MGTITSALLVVLGIIFTPLIVAGILLTFLLAKNTHGKVRWFVLSVLPLISLIGQIVWSMHRQTEEWLITFILILVFTFLLGQYYLALAVGGSGHWLFRKFFPKKD